MKHKLNVWQFVFQVNADYMKGGMGWRSIALGFIKLRAFPSEGSVITRAHYEGVLWRWRMWFPWEKV